VNSVPEHIPDEVAEDAPTDRRHGMKLIPLASSKKRMSFRIDVDDALLRPATPLPDGKRQTSRKRHLPKSEPSVVVSSAVALAVIAGLAVGFLVGRRRDGKENTGF